MKIEETDLFWFFYKRAFKGEFTPPPNNLCSYFWNAVGGAILWFLADLFIMIPTMVFVGLCWASYNAFLVFDPIKTSALCAFLTVLFLAMTWVSGFASVAIPIYRWHKWWDGYKAVQVPTLIVFALLTMPTIVLIGESYKQHAEGNVYPLTAFLIALGVEAAIILGLMLFVGIVYLFFTDRTNLGKNILAYLKALKDKNCPLVEPPQSYLDEQRAREMNVTDS